MNKEQFGKFKSLVGDLKGLIEDETLTWEEKHHIVFYTPGLASAICEAGLMKVSGFTSSNESEVMAFYNAAISKINYLEYYFQ